MDILYEWNTWWKAPSFPALLRDVTNNMFTEQQTWDQMLNRNAFRPVCCKPEILISSFLPKWQGSFSAILEADAS